jgi:hypothetical protein
MKRFSMNTPLFWLLGGGVLLAVLGVWVWWGSSPKTPVGPIADRPIANLHPVRASSAGVVVDFSGLSPDGLIPGQGAPQAELPVSFFDFGRLASTEVVQEQFLVVNRGQAPLRIQRMYTTCGCTVADLSSAEIPAGQAGLVTITFDAGFHDVTGTTVRRGVIMETNDPLAPTLEIWVQAAVADG